MLFFLHQPTSSNEDLFPVTSQDTKMSQNVFQKNTYYYKSKLPGGRKILYENQKEGQLSIVLSQKDPTCIIKTRIQNNVHGIARII